MKHFTILFSILIIVIVAINIDQDREIRELKHKVETLQQHQERTDTLLIHNLQIANELYYNNHL